MVWGMRPVRFLATRSSGVKERPAGSVSSEWTMHPTRLDGTKPRRRRKRRRTKHTLVPVRFTDDLVPSSIGLGEIFRGLGLLDLGEPVLRVAAMLVQGSHFHGFLDSGYVDCTHWIGSGQSLSGNGLSRNGSLRGGAGRVSGDGTGRSSGANGGKGSGARSGNVGRVCADGIG